MINIIEAVKKFGNKDVKSLFINYHDSYIALYKEPNGVNIGSDDVVKRVRVSEDSDSCIFLAIYYPKRTVEYYLNLASINYVKLNYY